MHSATGEGKGTHALDNRSDSHDPLGPRTGHLLHDGRVHPHPCGPGGGGRARSHHPGAKGPMKRLVAAVLLVVLTGLPSIAQANVSRALPPAVGAVPGLPLPAPAPAPVTGSRADATDYAAREAA